MKAAVIYGNPRRGTTWRLAGRRQAVEHVGRGLAPAADHQGTHWTGGYVRGV